MPNVGLSSFLKIVSKNTPQKAAEYAKYLTPGGYDFYWRLKEAARARTVEGKSYDASRTVIDKCSEGHEKKHNLAAFAALNAWLEKEEASSFFPPPVAAYPSPGQYISVKLEPEFGYIIKGEQRLVQLWATQNTQLNKVVAGCGLFLMKQQLCVDGFAGAAPAILNLRKKELWSSLVVPAPIGAMVASELAWADGFFKAHAEAA